MKQIKSRHITDRVPRFTDRAVLTVSQTPEPEASNSRTHTHIHTLPHTQAALLEEQMSSSRSECTGLSWQAVV